MSLQTSEPVAFSVKTRRQRECDLRDVNRTNLERFRRWEIRGSQLLHAGRPLLFALPGRRLRSAPSPLRVRISSKLPVLVGRRRTLNLPSGGFRCSRHELKNVLVLSVEEDPDGVIGRVELE